MKDAKGHGSNKRGGGVDQSKPITDAGIIRAKGISAMYGPGSPGHPSGVSQSDIDQYNAIIQKNSERNAAQSDLARANAPDGQQKTAAIAAQHGVVGPAVAKPVGPNWQDQRSYYGTAKVGNAYKTTGPHPTRDAARDEARGMLKGRSAARGVVSTGYGAFGPHFDIRWHSKDET